MWKAGEKQIAIAKESAGAALAAAEAATLQAKAAIGVALASLELKQIFLIGLKNVHSVNGGVVDGGLDLREFCGLDLHFKNVGRTPTRLIMQCVEWRVSFGLPAEPDCQAFFPFAPDTVLRPDDVSGRIFCANFQLSREQRDAVRERKASLWVYGIIGYEDFLGEYREKIYCVQWIGEDPILGSPVTFVTLLVPHHYVKKY
ncbi:MAG: hypothetical protein U1E20_00780 [Methylocystis sp.]|uniref:hypothetical protein n=1 Tax=Methylocystis sp. TaxID=1911079 RepID=UPI003939155C